jgi:hypothetical protein
VITLDPADLVRIATGLAAVGGGFGASFAFLKPYAATWIEHRLARAKRAAEIEDEARLAKIRADAARDGALERIAVQHERIVGVLETQDARYARQEETMARTDRRLLAIESHLGISPTPSAAPSAPAAPVGEGVRLPLPSASDHVTPRRALTDPDLRVSSLPDPPRSQPAGSPPRG